MMQEKEHINELSLPLKEILKKELNSGNRVIETSKSEWSNGKNILMIFLAAPFATKYDFDPDVLVYNELNDPHYWKAEYYDIKNNCVLACSY
jgi:hypothetical protein